MNVYLPAFYLGVQEELEKAARCWEGYEPVPGKEAYSEDSCRPKERKKKEKKAFDVASMPVNENIIPSLSGQTKWKYARTKDGLKLSDGNLVYSFGGFPEEYPGEDHRVSRVADDNILDFEKDSISKGTAQIHRASPDNIYMTLANGADNPTFMLQHEGGKDWRYSPSKKFLQKLQQLKTKVSPAAPTESTAPTEAIPTDSVLMSPKDLLAGGAVEMKKSAGLSEHMDTFMHPLSESASSLHGPSQPGFNLVNTYHPKGFLDQEGLSKMLQSGVTGVKDYISHTIDYSAAHPVSSLLKGYAISKGIDALQDYRNPERAALRSMDPDARRKHELYPLAFAALPVLASMAIKAQ